MKPWNIGKTNNHMENALHHMEVAPTSPPEI